MKVCSPSCGMAPGSGSGGEVYETELVPALVREGVTPHVLLARGKAVPAGLDAFVERVRPGRGLRWWVMPFVMSAAIRRCWRRHGFDVLRAHSLRFLGPACLLAKRRGRWSVPLVVHVHHLDPAPVPLRALERWVIRGADLIVTDSAFSRHQIQQYANCGLEKIVVAGCGVADALVPPGSAEVVGPPYVLVALGPLVRRKQPEFLVLVMRVLLDRGWGPDRVWLSWLGDGPLRGAMTQLASRLGVSDSVRFWGHVEESIKRFHLREMTALVHASTLEGLPLAVLEAMAVGKPVVARPAASLPSVLPLTMLANTVETFADVIERVLNDSSWRGEQGQRNAAVVEGRYRWRHVARRWVGAVKDLRRSHEERRAV